MVFYKLYVSVRGVGYGKYRYGYHSHHSSIGAVQEKLFEPRGVSVFDKSRAEIFLPAPSAWGYLGHRVTAGSLVLVCRRPVPPPVSGAGAPCSNLVEPLSGGRLRPSLD